jgi:hypothetical protein
MKLHPPTIDIPDEKPYENDLFGRAEFGASLTSLLKSIEEGVVLCVDAPWGEGKTTFARMWMADLKKQGAQCIYFDAYQHDYSDDPFVPFCAEIIDLAGKSFTHEKVNEALKERFREKAKRLGGKLLSAGTRIGVKALTLGFIKDTDIDALDSIRADLAESSALAASAAVGKAIDEYTTTKNDLEEFRERLSELAKAVRDAQGFPLVIVVDELDRCRPDFALALIERIKHLFSTNNVSFLLFANTAQLQNCVKVVYGSDVDAANYLHKFFTLTTTLPSKRSDSSDNNCLKYTEKLVAHYGLDAKHDVMSYLPAMFQHFRFTLREMERCLAILAVYYAQLSRRQLTDGPMIAFLAMLKLRHESDFESLAAGKMSFEKLVELTLLKSLKNKSYLRFPVDDFMMLLEFSLFPDAKFEASNADGKYNVMLGAIQRRDFRRSDLIPYFCSQLVRFSMAPDAQTR